MMTDLVCPACRLRLRPQEPDDDYGEPFNSLQKYTCPSGHAVYAPPEGLMTEFDRAEVSNRNASWGVDPDDDHERCLTCGLLNPCDPDREVGCAYCGGWVLRNPYDPN